MPFSWPKGERGSFFMTEEEKKKIRAMRLRNTPFKEIAAQLSLPMGSIRVFCSRNQIKPVHSHCLTCGERLPPQSRINKRFCSDICYRRWWESNTTPSRTFYTLTCQQCGEPFQVASHASQKFCSRDCYLKSRKGGQSDGE